MGSGLIWQGLRGTAPKKGRSSDRVIKINLRSVFNLGEVHVVCSSHHSLCIFTQDSCFQHPPFFSLRASVTALKSLHNNYDLLRGWERESGSCFNTIWKTAHFQLQRPTVKCLLPWINVAWLAIGDSSHILKTCPDSLWWGKWNNKPQSN